MYRAVSLNISTLFSVGAPHVDLVPRKARKGCQILGELGVIDCEPPCRCWTLNLSPLEEAILSQGELPPRNFNSF